MLAMASSASAASAASSASAAALAASAAAAAAVRSDGERMTAWMGAADGCAVVETVPGKGVGARARASLRAGQLVVAEEPFAFVAHAGASRSGPCGSCLRESDALMRCSRCHYARYCSKACQLESWARHRDECFAIRSMFPRQPPALAVLVARIVRRRRDLAERAKGARSRAADDVDLLVSHEADATAEQAEGAAAIAQLAARLVDPEEGAKDRLGRSIAALALDAVFKAACNTFSICNHEMVEIGAGLYPRIAMLNHACAPNCSCTWRGRTMLLRASRDIARGEALTVSYVDVWESGTLRRRDLLAGYSFTCDCARCTAPVPPEEAVPSAHGAALAEGLFAAAKTLSGALARGRRGELPDEPAPVATLVADVARALQLCLEAGAPLHHPAVVAARHALTDAAVDAADWVEAFRHATEGLRGMQALAPFIGGAYPNVPVQMVRVAKLASLHGMPRRALRLLQEARPLACLTHGEDHAFVIGIIDPLIDKAQLECSFTNEDERLPCAS